MPVNHLTRLGWLRRLRSRRFIAASALSAACQNEPAGIEMPATPSIDVASVAANPLNALSAIVSVRARHADSIAVRYRLANDAAAIDRETPAVTAGSELMTIPVLGLLPVSRYTLRPVVYGAGELAVGHLLDFTTDSLPSDLPRYVAGGADPSPGYVVFAAGKYGIVIDNTGRVVWYRHFPNGPGLSFMAQPTGRYVSRPPTPEAADLEPWVELDPLGNITRTLGCALGLQPRLHDLIAEPDGGYWLMCDESRTMDLTAVGGVAAARVTGTVVQHLSARGALLFHWSPFDHFAITDVRLADRTGPNVNWTHGNAIDFDTDGNLIASFRNLQEITKIDVGTGAVIWRLGGLRNEFTFLDTPAPAFAGQHSARAYGPGAILLLDNIGNPIESRVERYTVNESERAARLVHSYGSAPGVMTQIGGSVQPLPGGRTLVSFGTAGRVEEYDAAAQVVWRLLGNPGYVFRAQRIRSLYAPGVGMAR